VANEDNLINVRREGSRYFRSKKREYLRTKSFSLNQRVRIRTMETCIGIRKDYQPRTNLLDEKKGDLLEDPHKILNRQM
jgi:hypothetical protein